ncbi:MAG: D-glycero-alpha-D-manno-heptose-1,7-bisphosphate 7-phosphatase [Bacteroidota bacterium]
MNKALFLDRDGIINERIPNDYVKTPAEFKLIPESLGFFAWAKKHGYLTVIVTNQQGIGKGLMTEQNLADVHAYMCSLLAEHGFAPDAIEFCGDLAETNSTRRKPAPGMLLEAAQKLDIDLSSSWMIGDSISDAQAGKSAGTTTILVGTYSNIPEADYICGHVGECAEILIPLG